MSNSISILFVDDDPQILRSTSEWLGSYGHSVFEAQNVSAAASILTENQIELAFVDLRLGAENGMDVLLLIKENFPQIPVVFLSGHATVEEAMNAIRHGAIDFLTKPLLDNKILEIIENRIQNKKFPSQARQTTVNDSARFADSAQSGFILPNSRRISSTQSGAQSSVLKSSSAEQTGSGRVASGRSGSAQSGSERVGAGQAGFRQSDFARSAQLPPQTNAPKEFLPDARSGSESNGRSGSVNVRAGSRTNVTVSRAKSAQSLLASSQETQSHSESFQLSQSQSTNSDSFRRDSGAGTDSSVPFPIEGIVGMDSSMKAVFDVVERIADTRATVLLTGESGTGKSLLARSIHRLSRRRDASFVEVACGALPETLLESELFGHEIGAFTGAVSRKTGRFLQADGGTIFLDEIGTASPALQIKLLRVLQEFEFEPVGSTRTCRIDTRVILATNEDLPQAVAAGRFRQDLYYRINVINLQLPALRQRPGDIPELARFFLEKTNRECGRSVRGFDPETLRRLVRYSWPGNVRELQNIVERLVLLGSSPWILPTDLPEHIRYAEIHSRSPERLHAGNEENPPSSAFRGTNVILNGSDWQNSDFSPPSILKHSLSIPERQIILEALEAHHWSRTRTAEFLGINRTTLYKKMKKLQLDSPPKAPEIS